MHRTHTLAKENKLYLSWNTDVDVITEMWRFNSLDTHMNPPPKKENKRKENYKYIAQHAWVVFQKKEKRKEKPHRDFSDTQSGSTATMSVLPCFYSE